ncbi:MAG: FAD-binding oxidoreductase [Actinomycetes bacterium]
MIDRDRALVAALEGALPAGRVVLDPDVVTAASRDQATWLVPGRATALVRPRSGSEVAATARAAASVGAPLVPRGAGSGLSGGANAIDGCVVVDVSGMDRILDVDEVERLAVVEPGVLNAELDAAAATIGLWYPPDPASRAFSTIGGNVATNAGGLCCVKYGVTRDWVASLELCLASGETLVTGRATRKDVAGYDLTSLVVGSEGTLGIVTRVTVRLLPRPAPPATAVALFPDLASTGEAVQQLARVHVPSLCELVDGPTLRAVDDWRRMSLDRDAAAMLVLQSDERDPVLRRQDAEAMAAVCTAAGASTTHVTDDPVETDLLLEARRLAYPAVERLGAALLDDVGVPIRQLAGYLSDVAKVADRHDVRVLTFGHAGDGNLHPTVVTDHGDDDGRRRAEAAFADLVEAAVRRGGTATGEHGVGRLKTEAASRQRGPVSDRVHRAVKAAFDPQNLMNPGTLIEARP